MTFTTEETFMNPMLEIRPSHMEHMHANRDETLKTIQEVDWIKSGIKSCVSVGIKWAEICLVM